MSATRCGPVNRRRWFRLRFRLLFQTQVQDNLSGFFSIYRERLMEMDLDRIFWEASIPNNVC